MIWIAIIVGIILVFVFPKQMGILVAVVVIAIGAIYLYLYVDENNRKKQIEAVSISVAFNAEACSEEYPIAVNFKNGSKKTVEKIRWNIGAYRPGYSDNIVNYGTYSGEYSTPYETDRILSPGQTFGLCYKAPLLKSGASQSEVTWTIVRKSINFAQ